MRKIFSKNKENDEKLDGDVIHKTSNYIKKIYEINNIIFIYIFPRFIFLNQL